MENKQNVLFVGDSEQMQKKYAYRFISSLEFVIGIWKYLAFLQVWRDVVLMELLVVNIK